MEKETHSPDSEDLNTQGAPSPEAPKEDQTPDEDRGTAGESSSEEDFDQASDRLYAQREDHEGESQPDEDTPPEQSESVEDLRQRLTDMESRLEEKTKEANQNETKFKDIQRALTESREKLKKLKGSDRDGNETTPPKGNGEGDAREDRPPESQTQKLNLDDVGLSEDEKELIEMNEGLAGVVDKLVAKRMEDGLASRKIAEVEAETKQLEDQLMVEQEQAMMKEVLGVHDDAQDILKDPTFEKWLNVNEGKVVLIQSQHDGEYDPGWLSQTLTLFKEDRKAVLDQKKSLEQQRENTVSPPTETGEGSGGEPELSFDQLSDQLASKQKGSATVFW